MQRYFVDQTYSKEAEFYLTEGDYHHAIHVMRMGLGTKIFLVFSDQIAIIAEISGINELKKEVTLKELQREPRITELPISVTIACGYPKGEKLDLVAQKGTELGMAQLIGIPTKTSVVKWDQKKRNKKQERLQKIVKEAAEQSHRQLIPDVELLSDLQELFSQFSRFDAVLVAYEETAKQGEMKALAHMLKNIQKGQRLLIICGPEGGFSPAEIEQFQTSGARCCSLGPRILRAETAPLYALSAVSYQLELC